MPLMIGHLEHLPIEQLRSYNRNPRKGNLQGIKASLKGHGQYKPLLVNSGSQTGEEWVVLAGNHTLQAMRELNAEAREGNQPEPYGVVPVYLIDVDADTAARIVLADNKTSDDATYNDEALLDLLDSLPALDGTGYSTTDLADLMQALQGDELPDPTEEAPHVHDELVSVHLNLTPLLAEQWLKHANFFDSAEEALEYLLDHAS